MKIKVESLAGSEPREVEVPDAIFDYPYKEHLIHTAVQAVRAAARRGTHKTKVRSEVAGSGRKVWRQKGTGRSRVGGARSPIRKGGGTSHGPRPRSYEMGLSVREKKNALKSALSRKLADSELRIVESLELGTHKTAKLVADLKGLGIECKALLVDSMMNEKLTLAARNNPTLKTVDALAVNVYDVVDRDQVVVSEPALGVLVEVLSS